MHCKKVLYSQKLKFQIKAQVILKKKKGKIKEKNIKSVFMIYLILQLVSCKMKYQNELKGSVSRYDKKIVYSL